MNVLRTSTSPGPGSGSSTSTVRKLSGVGQPVGREARWISRVVRVMRPIVPAAVGTRTGSRPPAGAGGAVPWERGSALEGEGELHLAGRVHGGVEDLVVQELRGGRVEVDGRAVLLDHLVAGLAVLGGRDGEGRGLELLGEDLAGDAEPGALGEAGLGGDLVDDGAGVLGEREHVCSPFRWAARSPPPCPTGAPDARPVPIPGVSSL